MLLRKIFRTWLRLCGISRIRGHSLIHRLIPRDAVVADLGAHRGEFCSAMEETTKVQSTLCLEANPVLANYLMDTASKQTSGQIIHAALVGNNAPAELSFQISENPEASSILPTIPAVFGIKETVVVPTMTLDAAMNKISEPKVHLVKMDIEGAEIDVLKTTGRDTFARIEQLTVEFHDIFDPNMRADVREVRRHLKREHGFIELNASWPYTVDILFVNKQCIKRIGWLRFWTMVWAARAAYLVRGMLVRHGSEVKLAND